MRPAWPSELEPRAELPGAPARSQVVGSRAHRAGVATVHGACAVLRTTGSARDRPIDCAPRAQLLTHVRAPGPAPIRFAPRTAGCRASEVLRCGSAAA